MKTEEEILTEIKVLEEEADNFSKDLEHDSTYINSFQSLVEAEAHCRRLVANIHHLQALRWVLNDKVEHEEGVS